MAIIEHTHRPILSSQAQVLILPVNSAGTIIDPVITRCKQLYPDNYRRYRRACLDGQLHAGSCMMHKRALERTGLAAPSNQSQPQYIANLIISDHPYHPTRSRWLNAALIDLSAQLMPLLRYHGVRHIAMLARPLITTGENQPPMDWQTQIAPLITQRLQDLPKLRLTLHLPKSMTRS